MKIAVRIFNAVIMALSLVATVFLFASPTFSFNSHVALDVNTFAKFVPDTQYSKNINIVELIGTDEIHVGIKFSLNPMGTADIMGGSRDKINDQIVSSNVDEMIAILHDPVDLITEYSIRTVIKSTIIDEVTKQVTAAIEKAREGNSSAPKYEAEDIMDEVGMDDVYFTNFANSLYDSANQDTSTVDSVSDVLFTQIDEALAKAEESNESNLAAAKVDISGFSEETKTQIKDNLLQVLNELKLVEDGGHLKKISSLSYIYLAEYLKGELTGKVEEGYELEQKVGETSPDYADRLLKKYVFVQMPDMFYTMVGYVSLGLFIGLFVFTLIWVLLFIITLVKTFTKKPWTLFGPWFWIIGALQLVLGLGLTIFGKVIFPTLNIPYGSLPINTVQFAPRTYALIPSILFIAAIVLGIVYAFIKHAAKKEYQQEVGQ